MTDRAAAPVALVTGGAVRVGRALALGFAEAGYDLLVTYRSSEGPARAVAEEIEGLGRTCRTVQADLTDPAAADTVVGAVREQFGRLDVLVNSAASFAADPLADVDAEAWDRSMALNARAPHLLVRAAAGLLRDARGCVINIVDLSATQPWTGYAAHSVSKAALLHLTRIQAKAMAPEVRVNAIAPGAVLPPDGSDEDEIERLVAMTPLGRIGSAHDVVDAALYLVRAGFVTGEVVRVDGGRGV